MAEHIDIEAWDERGRHHTRLIPGTPPTTDHTLIPTNELEQLRAEITAARDGLADLDDIITTERAIHEATIARAEKTEAAIARAETLHSPDNSNPHGPWCGTCTTRWPCRTWTALLPAGNPPAPRELEAARAAIARVRRLCELTIAASCRVQAIEQARDTLAALDSPEEP
ncbi:hypothetical protein [Streptosporangium roseum]|uniref:hypothetical protein n=1 Tax=Streptosporangium roseum TaxID=2001 RepID=UPI0004CDCDA2|nr:hypothetical protein [Streptosporangium roseum]